MLRSINMGGTLTGTATRRTDGRLDVTNLDDRQGEVLEAARPGGEPDGDARLLLREAAGAAPEREARRRRRRHGEEAARAPDDPARAERGQARHAGPPGARRGPRGSRAAGARAQGRGAAAAAGARPAGEGTRGAAGEARRLREAAAGEDRGVPLAEGSDQGAVLGRGGPGEDRRGGDGDRRADVRHGPRDPARKGQDGADAGACLGDRGADGGRIAGGLHVERHAARPRAGGDVVVVAGRSGAREDEGRARAGRAAEGDREVIVRLMGEGQFQAPDELAGELNELDNKAVDAVTSGDEERLRELLEQMARAVRERGEALDPADLSSSDLIIPPPDLSLDEARELFSDEGLIPD